MRATAWRRAARAAGLVAATSVALAGVARADQQRPGPGQPAPAQPGAAPAVPSATGAPAATPAAPRTFSASAGLLFNTVRADRVADFEKVIGYLQAALEASTDPTVQAQAKGWRVFRAGEPGPGGSVLYVFVLDPAVPDADYGLGRILAAAHPDTTELQAIWKLYTGSITGGGSLLNLAPVPVAPAERPRAVAPAEPPR